MLATVDFRKKNKPVFPANCSFGAGYKIHIGKTSLCPANLYFTIHIDRSYVVWTAHNILLTWADLLKSVFRTKTLFWSPSLFYIYLNSYGL